MEEENQQFDDQELSKIERTLKILTASGFVAGSINVFRDHPDSAYESVSASAVCSSESAHFAVKLSGFSGEMTLEAKITFFHDEIGVLPGDERDNAINGFINWLVENSPVNLVIQRSYGRLATEPTDLKLPEWPERRGLGGTVSITMPVLEEGEQFSYPLPTGDETDPLGRAVNRGINAYFFYAFGRNATDLKPSETLSAFVDFLDKSQSTGLVPPGVRWSAG